MLTQYLFKPALLLQTLALALSIFDLIAFLWLSCTVWLNGDRRSMIARVGVVGLGLSAFFFFLHALLIVGPLANTSDVVSIDFLWHLIWFPALGVPYIWFVIGLYYASLINARWKARRPLLLVCGALLGCGVLALLFLNRSTFTFAEMLRLLAYNTVIAGMQLNVFSPLVWLPILFLCYVTFCAIGPWFTPGRVWRLVVQCVRLIIGHTSPLFWRRRLADAFWNDQVDAEQLEEPHLSWHLARPILLLAALLMVCLTISLGVLGLVSMLNWLNVQKLQTALSSPVLSSQPLERIPTNLILIDIYATTCVSLIVLLIGYSIVRYGILIERPLAHRGFFEQWRGTVIGATTLALFIALLVLLTHSSLGALLLIASITTGIYALFTWSSYSAHDRYVALLRPFLYSTSARHWLNTDLQKTEKSMEALFMHLCKDVLEVQCARLVVLTRPVKRNFSYRWFAVDMPEDNNEPQRTETDDTDQQDVKWKSPESVKRERWYSSIEQQEGVYSYRINARVQGVPILCWVLPIYDELGLVAKFYLGPRKDGGVFTNEDMDLALVCGQRILSTLRDHEAMLAVADLLRRRIVDVKLLGAQQRRVLHDELLPMLHLALLHLETARSLTTQSEQETREELGVVQRSEQQSLNEAITTISDVHRQLAAMMRAMAVGAPHRLERDGLMYAMRKMLEQDFQQSFDVVQWHVAGDVAQKIDELVSPAIAELIFAAVQEALRNAARHARGSDVHRKITLTVEATCDTNLEVCVYDNGIGIVALNSATTGTGGGLLTHSALLAIAGGSLVVKTMPGGGVGVRISLPIAALG
jgi:signal transduction histidine kinase